MLNPVWYYKPTGQWKDEIEKFQGICLYRSLGVLKSVPTRTMQRDAEILPVSIRREKKKTVTDLPSGPFEMGVRGVLEPRQPQQNSRV